MARRRPRHYVSLRALMRLGIGHGLYCKPQWYCPVNRNGTVHVCVLVLALLTLAQRIPHRQAATAGPLVRLRHCVVAALPIVSHYEELGPLWPERTCGIDLPMVESM